MRCNLIMVGCLFADMSLCDWKTASVTEIVVVDHVGTMHSTTLTDLGSLQLVDYINQDPRKRLVGWWHSHHRLSERPSDADLKATIDYCKVGRVFMGVSWMGTWCGRTRVRHAGYACYRIPDYLFSVAEDYLEQADLKDTRTVMDFLEAAPLFVCPGAKPVRVVSLGKHHFPVNDGLSGLP